MATTNGAQANAVQTRHPEADARDGGAVAGAPGAGRPTGREGMKLGKYAVGPLIGTGGMGAVHEGQDTFLKRKVAIKLLPDAVSRDVSAIRRFVLEARSFARVNHPNAVQIYEVDRRHSVCYLVMELMRGGSMQELLQREQAGLPWPEATQAVADACRALVATHAAGLVHRDIKPSNLMRSADGVVKLADFGLARDTGYGVTLSPTMPGGVVGTPSYMSPEQCRSEPVDARSDMYALGATYYHLLTGRPPYAGELPLQVLFAHCSAPVPDPRDSVADVPEACAAIVLRAMAKEPRDRYPSASAMLADLEAALSAGARSLTGESDGGETHVDPVLADLAEAVSGSQSGLMAVASGSASIPGAESGWESLEHELAAAAAARTGARGSLRRRPKRQSDSWLWAIGTAVIIAILLPVGIWHRGLLQVLGLAGDPAAQQQPPPRASAPLPKLPTGPQQPSMKLPPQRSTVLGGIADGGITLASDEHVAALAFSRDGMRLAAAISSGRDTGVKVWGTERGETRAPFYANCAVWSVAFAPENKPRVLAAAGSKGILLREHDEAWGRSPDAGTIGVPAHFVVFSPDGKHLAALMGMDLKQQTIHVWNAAKEVEEAKLLPETTDGRDAIQALAFSADSQYLAAGAGQTVKIWRFVDEEWQWVRDIPTGGPINALAFAPAGSTLAVAGDQGVQFWDAPSWTSRPTKWPSASPVRCLAYTSDARLLACGTNDGLLRTWDTSAEKPVQTLRAHADKAVVAMDFLDDSRVVATGGDDLTIRLFDLSKRNEIKPLGK
jgi:hypothetical protein